MAGELFDKKSDFFKTYFDKALSYEDFVKTGTAVQTEKWTNFAGKISLDEAQKTMLSGFTRSMNILVLSGVWCGDCARQCPMLDLMAQSSKVMNLKFIDNQTYPELRDELRVCGGSRVPMALILSEDFFEVSRFGDRQLSVYRKKALNELGAACDPGILPPPANELAEEVREWLAFVERAQLMLRLSPFLRNRYKD